MRTLRRIFRINIFNLGVSAILYYILLFFAVPVFMWLGVPGEYFGTTGTTGYALVLLAAGFFAFLLGYYNPISRKVCAKTPNVFKGEWINKRAHIAFWGAFSLGMAAKAVRIAGGAYGFKVGAGALPAGVFGVIGVLEWFAYIAIAIAFVRYYVRRGEGASFRLWQMYAWAALALEVAYAIPTCKKLPVIIPIFVFLIIRSYLVHVDWRWIVGGGLIIFSIFTIGNVCRAPQALFVHNVVEKGGAGTLSVDAGEAGEYVAHSFMGRVNQSFVFTRIVESDEAPMYGKPFLKFFVSLGSPRIIWEDKPVITSDKNDFGRRTGIILPDNYSTAVGRTNVGDWYMNFGIPGVVFGMFLMGVLWRAIYNYLIVGSGISASGVMVYAVLWPYLMKNMENEIAPAYAGVLKIFIILLLVHWFLRTRNNTKDNVK